MFKNAVMLSTLHKRFYGAHIESAKGSNQENRDYIRIEGKWTNDAKHETSLEPFEESGELPEKPQRRQRDGETILGMISEGATDAEILREYPASMSRLQHIGAARQTWRSGIGRPSESFMWFIYGERPERGRRELLWKNTDMKMSRAAGV